MKTTASTSIVKWLVAALVVWGIFLALGASGIWQTHGTAFNLRKALIVVACSISFLALWRLVFFNRRVTAPADQAESNAVDARLPSQVSNSGFLVFFPLVCSIAAWIVAFLPVLIPIATRGAAVAFLGTNLAVWLAAMISGMIRLSSPQAERKGAALWAVLIGAALATYVLISPLLPGRENGMLP